MEIHFADFQTFFENINEFPTIHLPKVVFAISIVEMGQSPRLQKKIPFDYFETFWKVNFKVKTGL